MAKKTSKTETNDLDLESWDDLDFDFDIDPPPADRNPVKDIGKGVIKGARDDIISPSKIRKRILDVMPEGYGRAANLVDEVGDTGRELYHTAVKDLAPATREFSRTMRRVMPKLEGKIPKAASKRLNKWFAEKEDKDTYGQKGVRESEVEGAMSGIFKRQMQEQVALDEERQAVQDSKDRIRDVQAGVRTRSLLQGLNNITFNTQRQADFQDQQFSRWMRKSLELQFRQTYATQDLLDLQTQTNKKMLESLGNITKNTGLPEYRKLQLNEVGGQMLRDRMMLGAQQKAVDFFSNYMGRIQDNFRKTIIENVKGFGEAASGALGMGNDMADMTEDISVQDKRQNLGRQLGTLGVNKLSQYAAPYLRERLGRNGAIAQGNRELRYRTEALPQLLNEWAMSDRGESGLMGGATRFLKDIIGRFQLDPVVGSSPLLQADKVAQFDNQAHRSIVEIIPGYLSRILQELTITRTGDVNTDRVVYNMDKGTFTSAQEVRQSIRRRIFNPEELRSSRESIDELINRIDPEGTLDDQLREELGIQLVRDSANLRAFDPKRLSESDAFTSERLDGDQKARLADLFRDRFGVEERVDSKGNIIKDLPKTDDLLNLSQQYTSLTNTIPDPMGRIQGYHALGYRDFLQDMGLLNQVQSQDHLNYDRVWESFRRGEVNDDTTTTSTPSAGGTGSGGLGGGGHGGAGGPSSVPPAYGDAAGHSALVSLADGSAPVVRTFTDLLNRNTQQIVATFDQSSGRGPSGTQMVTPDDVWAARLDQHTRLFSSIDQKLDVLQTLGGFGPSQGGRVGALGNRVGAAWQWARQKGGSLGHTGLGAIRRVGGMYGGLGRLGLSGLQGGFDLARRGVGALRNRASQTRDAIDVYVRGELSPRLERLKMLSGEYRDKVTNKVITSLDDLKALKGDVIDRAGNVILSLNDAKQGLVDKYGKKLKAKFSWGLGLVKGAFNQTYGRMFRLPGQVVGRVRGFIQRARDIYVAGEAKPRLLAFIMRNGGYFNQSDMSPIRSFKDIKGTVVDAQGNVVLPLEDMQRGLLDVKGRALSVWGRLKGRLKGAVGLARRGGGWLKRMASGGLRRGRNVLSRLGGGIGRGAKRLTGGIGEGVSSRSVLVQIRDILDERLPGGKPKFGDRQGDGLRDGGWRSIRERRAKRREEREERRRNRKPRVKKEKGSGMLGSILGAIGTIGGVLVTGFSTLAEVIMGSKLVSGATDMLGGDSPDGKRKPRKPKTPRPKGGGKLWTAAKTGGAWLLAKGGQWAAERGLAQLATRTAITAGTALAGTLSAPVLLTGAVIAGAAYGGYKLYQHLTKERNAPLRRYRHAQYGVDPDNGEDTMRIGLLEDFYQQHTTVRQGNYTVKITKADVGALFDKLGFNEGDERGLEWFNAWRKQRFEPVFLKHIASLSLVHDDVSLLEVDKVLSGDEKKRYLNSVGLSFGEGPLAVNMYPFSVGARAVLTQATMNLYREYAEESVQEDRGKSDGKRATQLSRDIKTLRDDRRKSRERQSGTMAVNAIDLNTAFEKRRQASDTTPRTPPANQRSTGLDDMTNPSSTSGQGFRAQGKVIHPGNGSGGNINELPLPSGDGSYEAYEPLIAAVARMTGVDASSLAVMTAIESGFRGSVKASGSSATGLMQFIKSTWSTMLERYGSKYGISPNTPPTDVRANLLMGAEYLKENAKAIKSKINRGVTTTDLYLAHFMGAGGARSFLSANPATPGRNLFQAAASANPSIFYDKGRARSLAEIYKVFDKKVSGFQKDYGDRAAAYARQAPDPKSAANDEVLETSPGLDESSIATAVSIGSASNRKTPSPQPEITAPRLSYNLTAGLDNPAQGARALSERSETTEEIKRQQQETSRRNAQVRDTRAQELSDQQSAYQSRVSDLLGQQLATQNRMASSLERIEGLLQEGNQKEIVIDSSAMTGGGRRPGGNGTRSTSNVEIPVSVRRQRSS